MGLRAALLTLGLAGCSSGAASTVDGTVGGRALAVKSVLAWTYPGDSVGYASATLLISDLDLDCATANDARKNQMQLGIFAYATPAGNPLVTGRYDDVGGNPYPPHFVFSHVSVTDAACSDTGPTSHSGTTTLDQLSPRVAGTYSFDYGTGVLSGRFDASLCPGPAASSPPPSCH